MKLADYLSTNHIKRIDFARKISVTPGWITCLCDETGWPSRDVVARISEATEGAVTADDFMSDAPPTVPADNKADATP